MKEGVATGDDQQSKCQVGQTTFQPQVDMSDTNSPSKRTKKICKHSIQNGPCLSLEPAKNKQALVWPPLSNIPTSRFSEEQEPKHQ